MFTQYCDVFHNAVPALDEYAESIVITSHRRGNALSPMFSGDFGCCHLTVQQTHPTNNTAVSLIDSLTCPTVWLPVLV